MRSQTTRTIGGRINSDGSIATPGPFTARRTAAGDYTVTFTDRLIAAVANYAGSSTYFANAQVFTGNSFRVLIYTTGGVLTDNSFVFTAVVAA